MLWLTNNKGVKLDESKLRLFACDCAEAVLLFFEEKYPEDKRPRQAVETACLFAKGEATRRELKATAAAALTTAEAAENIARKAAKAYEHFSDARRDADRAIGPAYNAGKMAADRAADAAYKGSPASIGTMNTAIYAAVASFEAATCSAFAAAEAAGATAREAETTFRAVTASAEAAVAAMSACIVGAAMNAAMDAAKAAAEAAAMAAAVNGMSARSTAYVWQADRLRFYFPAPFDAKQ